MLLLLQYIATATATTTTTADADATATAIAILQSVFEYIIICTSTGYLKRFKKAKGQLKSIDA